jgi:hypothetical protein
MGLDMYVTAEKYLWELEEDEHEVICNKIQKAFGVDMKVKSVEFDAMYWRKANAIHKWFVDNVQDGVDDCRRHYFKFSDLLKLRMLCDQVLKNRHLADKLLPTQEGFFFGHYEYDEYYFGSIQDTIKMIDGLKQIGHIDSFDLYYQSSW